MSWSQQMKSQEVRGWVMCEKAESSGPAAKAYVALKLKKEEV